MSEIKYVSASVRNGFGRSTPKHGLFLLALGLAGAATSQAQTGTVNFQTNQQQVEGFGFAEPFGAAKSVSYLSQDMQNQVWDLMFNPTTGAGLDILRIGINTDFHIEPNSPGSPAATPTYVFDGSDDNQVQAAQIAQHYGVNDFFATSWTAPAFMKTNNSENNGGSLCGTTGATCPSGDWRQAYANFLVQYINDYKSVGVPITGLGFVNEPDFTATYQSMRETPAQVADFFNNALGPTMRAQEPQVRLMCCDAFNWGSLQPYVGTLPYYAPFASYVDIVSGHEYGFNARFAQATTKPVWMTEWATLNTTDDLNWDCSGCDSDGMYLANDIITAFNAGNVNAYTYWWGTANQSNTLVEIYLSNTAPGYFVIPGRYYAMAAMSRYVRPGAYRVATTTTDTNLNVVAFRNTDGSKVLEVLNKSTTGSTALFTIDAGTVGSSVRTLLTNAAVSLRETDNATVAGTQLSVNLPARSLTTMLLPPAAVAGSVQLTLRPTLTKLGDGSFQVALKLTNSGTGTAQNVTLTNSSMGLVQATSTPLSALPQLAGTGSIAPGGYTVVSLNFTGSAGTSGSMVIARYSGTFNGGTFGGSFRTVLP